MGLFDDIVGQSEAPRANNRGFAIGDVQAAVRGDMFNSPGLPISYAAKPGQTFGQSATENAQPFQNIVAHHTGGPSLQSALSSAQRGDPLTGAKYGYHFYIDTDGSVVQGAPLDARTNHVKGYGGAHRTSRPDIGNENSVGVSFVGSGNPNEMQVKAAENLSRSLMERYGIQTGNVVGHGEIQRDRQSVEGMPLVNALRNGPQMQPVQQPVRMAAAPSQVMSDAAPEVRQPEPFVAQRPDSSTEQFIPQRPDSRAEQAFIPQRPDSSTDQAFQPQRPDSRADQRKSSGLFDDIMKPDIGRGTAFLTGAEQGLNFNFADEKRGVQAAAGTPKDLQSPLSGPSDFVTGLAKLGYEYLTGGGEAAQRYAQGRDEFREQTKTAEEQYPGTTIAGNVAGAIALPVGGLMSAPTIGARMARGAGMGAVTGGAAGIGDGTTVEERAGKGAVGVVAGGVLGGLGVPVVEGAVRGVGAAVSKPVNMLSSAVNPTGAAERAVGRAYREASEADPNAINRLAQNELRPGGPETVMDTLGAPGRDLARSAANLSGGARDKLNATLDDRFENQGNRLTDWFRSTFHYPDAHAQQKAIETASEAANGPAYAKAFRDPRGAALWDEGFEQISQAPVVQDAIRKATITAANDSAKAGFTPVRSPFVMDKGTGRMVLRENADGSQAIPGIQFWNSVKKNLDSVGTRDAQDFARILRTHVDDYVPSYRDARAGAAAFFGAENALEAGQKFVTTNFAVPQTREALAKMSPTERQLFQDGFVSRMVEMLEKVPDRADVVKKIYNNEANRQKIQLVLGPQRSKELEARLRVEGIMQQGLKAVQGNSTTAQQLLAAGLAGGAGGGYLGFDPSMSGAAGALALAGKRGIDSRVANKVAEMLTSSDPAVLNRGIKMIASNGRLMGALRSADGAAARVSGGQTQALPAPMLQLPAPGRAEDQPGVPRPPGQ